ncbi:MAG: acetate/propionate family kinase [Ginsengibacter sp.]
MNIFVINSGSSSLKYQLIEMPSEILACSGIVERIGKEDASVTHKIFKGNEEQVKRLALPIADHEQGLKEVVSLLTDQVSGIIKDLSEIQVVGHRVVHGGESFAATTIITSEVKEEIKKLFPLASLHNPPNYLGIEVAEKLFPGASQIAVFDTAFHQTLPPEAYRYAIPAKFYKEDRIRVYGFHGTSHKYVSEKAIKYLQKEKSKIITIHLGNGCSMTAVRDGKSVDTSMGFGPMNGLIMGTRAGDIDQSVIFYLVHQLGHDLANVKNILNYDSGMIGLTGSNDMRDIIAKIENTDKEAVLAYNMYAYRIRKYIGSYTAVLNGLDAIVFTGGVGENDSRMRELAASDLEYLGIHLDRNKNNLRASVLREINTEESAVKILVIPTNEELEIASQCYVLMLKAKD